MPFFSTAHHTLYYVVEGDDAKPPLLLLHGFLGSHQDFLPLRSTLSLHFYCIVPDLPGHGQTKTEPNSYTFPKAADSLLVLLHHLNIYETNLLGYSMGGRLALYLVCEFPDCFMRVVLESASPGLKTEKDRAKRRESDDVIARRLQKTPLSQFLTQWYQNPLFSSLQHHSQLYSDMLQRRQQNNKDELTDALRGFSTGCQPSLWSALWTLETPLLLLAGELDSKFVSISQDMIAQIETVPVSVLRIVEHCGHNIHLESPIAFSHMVSMFCQPSQTRLL